MKFPLEIKRYGGFKNRVSSEPSIYISKTLPFVENKRGVLIHRPRFVHQERRNKNWPTGAHNWLCITHWCGSPQNGDVFTFHAEPPHGMVVCERCEKIAVKNGLPSSSEIVGKHVHVGKVVSIRTCCPN